MAAHMHTQCGVYVACNILRLSQMFHGSWQVDSSSMLLYKCTYTKPPLGNWSLAKVHEFMKPIQELYYTDMLRLSIWQSTDLQV
jgi:hypothetical protein